MRKLCFWLILSSITVRTDRWELLNEPKNVSFRNRIAINKLNHFFSVIMLFSMKLMHKVIGFLNHQNFIVLNVQMLCAKITNSNTHIS